MLRMWIKITVHNQMNNMSQLKTAGRKLYSENAQQSRVDDYLSNDEQTSFQMKHQKVPVNIRIVTMKLSMKAQLILLLKLRLSLLNIGLKF